MSELAQKIVAIHNALEQRGLPHAFGGALALAWCTGQARGTIDIDINIFVAPQAADAAVAALPQSISAAAVDIDALKREGQVRLWWDNTPVDVFLNATAWHDTVAERIKEEAFFGSRIPFLGCSDLAVFKALFSRTKDWADIEEMLAENTVNVGYVINTLTELLDADDERIHRLKTLF